MFPLGPLPVQSRRLLPIGLLAETRRLEISLQRFSRRSRRLASIQSRVEDLRQRLAKLPAMLNRLSARFVAGRTPQPARLRGSQQFRLRGEPQKIAVAGQQFLGSILPESPVQSIDQIERRVTRHQKKSRAHCQITL